MVLLQAAQKTSVVYDALMQMDTMDPMTTDLIQKVAAVAASIAGICFVCSLAHNYFKSSFKSLFTQDASEFPNYMEIGRGVVMIICIAAYPAIAQILSTTVETLNSKTNTSNLVVEVANTAKNAATETMAFSWKDRIVLELRKAGIGYALTEKEKQEQAYAKNSIENSDGAPDSAVNPEGEKAGIFDLGAMLDPANWIPSGLNFLTHMIVGVIHIIIAGFAVIMFKVLLIVGPLAFAFSILPAFENQLSNWFGTLLNVGFVFTTLNIMEHIVSGMYTYIYSHHTAMESLNVFVLDLVIIFSTCSSFWITSKFVGKGDGGRVLTKLVNSAVTAATMVAGAAVPKGGGNLSNVTNIGQNILRNNS
jgi:hypothetical protein